MELSQIIEFSWNAITGGVYYDALKATLGNAFSKLDAFKKKTIKHNLNWYLVLSSKQTKR